MVGYWWPTMFLNAHQYMCHCHLCQQVGCSTWMSAISLVAILVQTPFKKWGIDFVKPIAPTSSHKQKRNILVAINYVTKWAEAIATKTNYANTIATFLYKNIITYFGCPKELVNNCIVYFINATSQALIIKYKIKHKKTTPYHPRANGQTKKTNSIMSMILTKTLTGAQIHLDGKLLIALLAYHTTYKVATNSKLSKLVFKQEAIPPIQLELSNLQIPLDERLDDKESFQFWLTKLTKLDEIRVSRLLMPQVVQCRQMSYYNNKVQPKSFMPHNLVLLYDSRYRNYLSKLQIWWHGPYHVAKAFKNGFVQLEDCTRTKFTMQVNGNHLQSYCI